MSNILEISNLTINFATRDGSFKAVDNISFNIESNKTMALVGESGSGKSVTALSVLPLSIEKEILFTARKLSSLEKNSTDKFFISSKLLAIAKNLQGKRNF